MTHTNDNKNYFPLPSFPLKATSGLMLASTPEYSPHTYQAAHNLPPPDAQWHDHHAHYAQRDEAYEIVDSDALEWEIVQDGNYANCDVASGVVEDDECRGLQLQHHSELDDCDLA